MFCRRDQVQEEIEKVLDLAFELLSAFGFKDYEKVQFRNIYVFPESIIGKSGWSKVIDWFFDNQINGMYSNPNRVAIFVVDFDEKKDSRNRREYVKNKIPPNLENRIFVLGFCLEFLS